MNKNKIISFLILVICVLSYSLFKTESKPSATNSIIYDASMADAKVRSLQEVQDFTKRVKDSAVMVDSYDDSTHTFRVHVFEAMPDHDATFGWYNVSTTTNSASKESF